MCGLAGVFSHTPSEAMVRRMVGAVVHRGPDDGGIEAIHAATGENVGVVGHRRLAILDPSPAGRQPMRSVDGRFTVAFNGEIYNFPQLRAELERGGAVFRTRTDTEVLLRGWAAEGPLFLQRLRGMYAFALWDRDGSVGFLVRDPFGIKPLYVAETAGGVLFASELRAVLASGVLERRLSRDGLASFLAGGAAAEPFTLVDGVRMLPAGTLTRVRIGHDGVRLAEAEPFAEMLAPRGSGTTEASAGHATPRELRQTLAASVARHLLSDVPLGLFLSGGLDSSAVVALAAEAASAPLDTFTVTFSEARFNEAAPARAVARRFGTRHHEIPLSADELLRALPAAFAAMDQPSMDGINTYVVSGAVRAHGIKVALSGLGGDEQFAGYPSFRRAARLRVLPLMAAGLTRSLGRALAAFSGERAGKAALLLSDADPARAAYIASRALFAPAQVAALLPGCRLPQLAPAPQHLPLLRQVAWYETTDYMRNVLLRDGDIFGMAHGLEIRVPFVDLDVAAVAGRLDDSVALAPDVSKPALRAAVRDLLPREVWDRPKQGFTFPFESWLRGALHAEAAATFEPSRLARVGLEVPAALQVWEGFRRRRVGWARPWALHALVRWAELNDVCAEPVPAPARRVRRGQRAAQAS